MSFGGGPYCVHFESMCFVCVCVCETEGAREREREIHVIFSMFCVLPEIFISNILLKNAENATTFIMKSSSKM